MERIRDEHMKTCLKFDEFGPLLDKKFIILSPFCGAVQCEDRIKELSQREEQGAEVGQSMMGVSVAYKEG